MSMGSEFKDFAMRGNVVDMAVGIVIGGAFGKIVSSFVADVLMPPIGIALGGVNFSDLSLTLKEVFLPSNSNLPFSAPEAKPIIRMRPLVTVQSSKGDSSVILAARAGRAVKSTNIITAILVSMEKTPSVIS